MASVKEGPAVKGDIKPIASADGGTKVITNARPASGAVVKGPAPGSGDMPVPSDGIVLEGLGSLNADNQLPVDEDPNAGSGEYVVVLIDFVAGVNSGYGKGDVRRISNFIPGYGDTGRSDEARANAKRLFDLKALRLATREEAGTGHIEVRQESDELTQERNRRIELENQIEELKKAQSLNKDVTTTVPDASQNWS